MRITTMLAAAAAALTLGTLSGAALADESWTGTDKGIYWETDAAGYAVLAWDYLGDEPESDLPAGRLFVRGLTGSGARGTFEGYWVDYGEQGPRCPKALTDALGNEVWHWGKLTLTFDKPQYPSGWHAVRHSCDGGPDEAWEASAD